MARDPQYERCVVKYRQIRRLTRDQLEEEAQRELRLKIKVLQIDKDALDAIAGWVGRKVAFPWKERILPTYEYSHPSGLDFAIWKDGQLCGVAVARLSDSKEWLSITHIEGAPGPHPLKKRVVPLVLVGADIYTTLVQRWDDQYRLPTVRIMNPLAGSIAWYGKCGYSRLQKANGYTYVTST